MENIFLLTGIATLVIFGLYFLDGKLSEKNHTLADYLKMICISGGTVYFTLLNHNVPKQVFQEVIEAGPPDF